MIQNAIVVIPFNIPWEWSTDYTNQTAKILSNKNIVICFLWEDALSIKEYLTLRIIPNLFKKHSKNLFVYTPVHIIPFRRFKSITSLNLLINVLLVKSFIVFFEIRLGKKEKVVWTFHPSFYQFIKLLGKRYVSIYDCVDYYLTGSREEKAIVKKNEGALLKKADVVTAISRVLKSHLEKIRKKVFLVPQGFRLEHFIKIPKTEKMVKGKKPLLGFVGGINDRLNYPLLSKLIKRNPQWDFVLWGPVQKVSLNKKNDKTLRELFSLPNVIHGFFKDRKKLPSLIQQFDIGIIPYDSSDKFNLNCYPMKIFEYFYLGKPVITTTILELKKFPRFIKMGETVNEWEETINKLLAKPWPSEYKRRQRKLAKDNSWENKIEEVSKLINSFFPSN